MKVIPLHGDSPSLQIIVRQLKAIEQKNEQARELLEKLETGYSKTKKRLNMYNPKDKTYAEIKSDVKTAIEAAKMEGHIETGYHYWVNTARLIPFNSVLWDIDTNDYWASECLPIAAFFDTARERDINAERVASIIVHKLYLQGKED